MKSVKKRSVYAALLPFVLWLLSGCAVYDSVRHPHRLPTPKMDAATKAKARAAEKARHKGTTLKAIEASSDATTPAASEGGDPAAPNAAPAPAEAKKKTLSYSDLPEGTKLKYDKQGLVRKSRLDRMALDRRKLHHYDNRPPAPRDASRENRRLRKRGRKGQEKNTPRAKTAIDPALDTGPDPGPPALAPVAPAESLPPAGKGEKPGLPKPDPTQPAPAPKPAKSKAQKVLVPKPDPTQPAP